MLSKYVRHLLLTATMLATGGVAAAAEPLRVVMTPGMFVTRADSPHRSIADLRGNPVAFGAKGSGLVILARYVLDGMGLDMDKDFQAVYLDRAGDGPAMVADGRVAALWGGGSSWPGFVAVADAPAGGRFIVPDAKEIEAIGKRHSFPKVLVLPPNSFKGQTAALTSLGSWSFVMARKDLPDETAYRLTRALHRGEAAIAGLLPQAKETTAANTATAVPEARLLHPGTLKYLQALKLKGVQAQPQLQPIAPSGAACAQQHSPKLAAQWRLIGL